MDYIINGVEITSRHFRREEKGRKAVAGKCNLILNFIYITYNIYDVNIL